MTSKKMLKNRGKIETVTLSKPIVFNGNRISIAIIEIDHINFGLDKKSKELSEKKARTNFTVKDIEKFLKLLDGEDIAADDYKGKTSLFSIRMSCPVQGKFYGKEFIMIFDTHYDRTNEIHTITLIPGWKK
tara:strand:- start:485 stop:877 length:393 start_codon:yes stop_codon:yes gene_type:complete